MRMRRNHYNHLLPLRLASSTLARLFNAAVEVVYCAIIWTRLAVDLLKSKEKESATG